MRAIFRWISFKNRVKFLTYFYFIKKFYIGWKQGVNTLVLIYRRRPGLGDTIKTNFITFQTVIKQKRCPVLIFYKRVCDELLHHILRMIFKKNISHLCFINWSNFIAWLFLRLEILSNMYIIIICCTVCEIKFWN